MNNQDNREQGSSLKEESILLKIDKLPNPYERRLSESNILSIIKRYDAMITLANQKASFLMGSAGIVLITAIVEKQKILTATGIASIFWLNGFFYYIAVIGLFGILGCSFLIILPFTKSHKYNDYTSFIAYSSVAKLDLEYFKSKLSSADYDFWSDLVIQTHQLAIITDSKFKILKFASCFAFFSILSIAILFFMMVIK